MNIKFISSWSPHKNRESSTNEEDCTIHELRHTLIFLYVFAKLLIVAAIKHLKLRLCPYTENILNHLDFCKKTLCPFFIPRGAYDVTIPTNDLQRYFIP